MPRHLISVALFLAMALGLIGCDRSSPAAGSNSPAPAGGGKRGARIVALSPALASTLRNFGSGSMLVGRHGADAWSDQSLPVCGDLNGIDYEALLRAAPTDVLLQHWATEPPRRLMEMAAAHGWNVREYPLLSLQDVEDAAADLIQRFPPPTPPGSRAGEPTRQTADSLRAELHRAWSPRDGMAAAGRVLLVTATRPKTTALGPGSWHHQILERIGGKPAIDTGEPYITLDAEDVLRLAPDVIVLFEPRPPGSPATANGPLSADRRRELLGPLASLHIPAVVNGRVGLIDDPECLLPSTSMARVADELAAVILQFTREPPSTQTRAEQ